MLVCAAKRKEPNAMRRPVVQSAEQTFCSQAAKTAKGSGKASLRCWFCCGDANARTESALSIGLGEMRTLVRSSVCNVSQACIRSRMCTS